MIYDKEVDALYIKLKNTEITGSEETETNVVLDFDKDNTVVGIEIINFVKKYKNDIFPAFKEVEKAVWKEELALETDTILA